MKKFLITFLSICFVITMVFTGAASEKKKEKPVSPALNGLKIPEGFENWSVISVSYRKDRDSIRVILGNDIAVKAARAGKTNPWPDGSIIGKVAWSAKEEELWPDAIVPDKFLIAEFMYKDSKKFASNGTGWGWARWVGSDRKPYGKNKDFVQECIDCHSPAEENDWVFTHGALMR